jgi:hypothetical protein
MSQLSTSWRLNFNFRSTNVFESLKKVQNDDQKRRKILENQAKKSLRERRAKAEIDLSGAKAKPMANQERQAKEKRTNIVKCKRKIYFFFT